MTSAGFLSLPAAVAVFSVGAAALVFSAVALARGADHLAELTGISRLMIGTILLAFATSLPEIVTGVAATLGSAPDLAVGNIFGSSMANMAILAVLDLRHRGNVLPSVEVGHARVAALAIVLTAIGALGVYLPGLELGWIGPAPVVIAVVYVGALVMYRRRPARELPAVVPVGEEPPVTEWSLRQTMMVLAAATVVVLVAAPAVAIGARDIAVGTGIGETFVGTTLVALSTSLPELITSLAAVRIGSYDLAVGNLFGSNAANMVVLLPIDLVSLQGSILAEAAQTQIIAAFGAILLMGIATSSIIGGDRGERFEVDALLLLVAYTVMVALVGVAG